MTIMLNVLFTLWAIMEIGKTNNGRRCHNTRHCAQKETWHFNLCLYVET